MPRAETVTANVAATTTTPLVSVKPVTLAAPDRDDDLRVKVSAPTTGQNLPILLFSHGSGSSMDGYEPLTDYWAAHGFVVIQPTHLDSRTVGLTRDDPRTPHVWRYRVDDMHRILDNLGLLESAVPGLTGRLDRNRIAAAGHSFGGQTAGILLGLRVVDPETGQERDLSDRRVTAGVLLATAGQGGDSLTPFAAENLPHLNVNFAHLNRPALVIVGDQDDVPRKNRLTVRGADWMTDPYFLSPGAEAMLTLFGAEHSLGGIAGYEVQETTDESPRRVHLIQRITLAYLRHALGIDDSDWARAQAELAKPTASVGRLDLHAAESR